MLNNITGAARSILPMQPAATAPATPSAAPAAPTTDGAPTPNAIIHETVISPTLESANSALANGVSQAVPDVGQVLRNGVTEGLKGLTDIGSNIQELAQSAFGTGPEGILNNLSSMASQFIQDPTAAINSAIDQDGKSSNIIEQIGNHIHQGVSAFNESDVGKVFSKVMGDVPVLAGQGIEQGISAIENLLKSGQNVIHNAGADLSDIQPNQASSQANLPENAASVGDAQAIQNAPEIAPPPASPMPGARPEAQVEDSVGAISEGIQAVAGPALSAPVSALGALSEGPRGDVSENLAAQANAQVQGVFQAALQGNPVQAVMQAFEAARPKGI